MGAKEVTDPRIRLIRTCIDVALTVLGRVTLESRPWEQFMKKDLLHVLNTAQYAEKEIRRDSL
jgi:hypothetical protein